MDPEQLRVLLAAVAAGTKTIDQALIDLRNLPYEDLGFARLDHHRTRRTGVPEVIFGQGKTPAQVAAIVERFVAHSGQAFATRVSPEAVALVCEKFPEAKIYESARILTVGDFPQPADGPFVAVASAGTSDMPVAEEAAVTIEIMGTRAVRVYDVGVAGLHRVLDRLDVLREAE